MKDKLVVCVWKYPVAGKVKTRLWKKIGMEKAALIQRKFLEELIKNNYNKEKKYDFLICLLPIEKAEDFEKEFWVKAEDILASQGNDLGAMMTNIFIHGFDLKYKEIILIWSDLATLDSTDFNAWFDVLQNNDIVLWEALDGGFYLVWMKQLQEKIFQDIVYSTETVLAETVEKCRENKLSYDILEWKMDIDTYEDLVEETSRDTTWFYKNIIKIIDEK